MDLMPEKKGDQSASQLTIDDSETQPLDEPKPGEQLQLVAKNADFCPSCGNATLVYEMGCSTCYGCGYSAC
jgi:hypothetical protein